VKWLGKKREMQESEEAQRDVKSRLVDVGKILRIVRYKRDVSRTSWELFFFLLYIILYTAVIILQKNAIDNQSLQASLRKHFLSRFRDPTSLNSYNFLEIRTEDMFWSWHEFFIKSLIYVENYENGMPRASPRRNMILQHNKLTSGFRMTQRRAKLETCPFADKKYLIFAPSCAGRTYSEGLAGSVDESPFLGAANKTEFVYQSIDTLGSKEVGYFQMFGLDMQASESQLKLLKQERWINQGTSWYRLDFVVYNPNVALYCKINMKIIFDNTGCSGDLVSDTLQNTAACCGLVAVRCDIVPL